MLETIFRYPDLSLFLALMVIGYSCGTIAEKRHYKSIIKREQELVKLMVVNAEGRFAEGAVRTSFLVNGSTVVSNDYFKRLLAILRNIFGGRSKSYEGELAGGVGAVIEELRSHAEASGADAVVGIDIDYETVNNAMLMISASGTAVRLG